MERGRRPVRSYRDLQVWERAMELVTAAYALAGQLPAIERFGLGGQMRRSAVSIASNIAEGHGRDHLGDYLRHLSIAKGSVMELETQTLIAGRLGFVDAETAASLLRRSDEVSRMLSGLSASLARRR